MLCIFLSIWFRWTRYFTYCYTEGGEEYFVDQRGLVEYDWFKLDEIVPFRDKSQFKEYYWGIGVYLYIRKDLYDKVISAMERIEKLYHMMPTEKKIIWKGSGNSRRKGSTDCVCQDEKDNGRRTKRERGKRKKV